MSSSKRRCGWAGSDPDYVSYHDREWGVPLHEDRALFEFLILEGFQAGLSWITILKKRENFRMAFLGFDPRKVARFDRRKVSRLLGDEGIVRNRLKIDAAIGNARAFLRLQREHGSFEHYLWAQLEGAPRRNRWRRLGDIPARTVESDALSRDLKSEGFRFVGSTICYAYMQAVGMVNDHLTTCFRYREIR